MKENEFGHFLTSIPLNAYECVDRTHLPRSTPIFTISPSQGALSINKTEVYGKSETPQTDFGIYMGKKGADRVALSEFILLFTPLLSAEQALDATPDFGSLRLGQPVGTSV
jgi:hypothetical protein